MALREAKLKARQMHRLSRFPRLLLFTSGTGLLTYQFLSPQNQQDVLGTAYATRNLFTAASTFVAVGVDYAWGLRGLKGDTDEYYEARKAIHSRCAQRILKLSTTNKGVYLKFGQYIGNLERIAPKEYTDVLKVLQDSGPQVPFDQINTVIKTDFGKDVKELFDSFDEKAIAAASLAQVHQAVYKGEKVAVKVQFPTLRVQFDQDIRVLGMLIRVADKALRWYQYKEMNLHKIFSTFSGSLREELDFKNEMENAQKTADYFKDLKFVYVPKYAKELSGSRVLTMDFVEGVKINQKADIEKLGFESKKVGDLLMQIFARMIFQTGHVHCDAHPGNILVRPNPLKPKDAQIVLLDHGFYRSYDAKFVGQYCKLWKSIIEQDYETMKEVADSFGMGEYYKYLPLVLLWRSKNTKKLGDMIPEADRKNMQKKDLINFEIIHYIMTRIPEHMIFIIRASNLSAIHYNTLGGTMRGRFMLMTEGCYRNLYGNGLSYRWHMMILRVKLWIMETSIAFYRVLYPTKVEVY